MDEAVINPLDKFLDDMNKKGVKEHKAQFKDSANKIIDEAKNVAIVISETQIEALGLPHHVVAGLLTAIDEVAHNEMNKEFIKEKLKLLLESLENE